MPISSEQLRGPPDKSSIAIIPRDELKSEVLRSLLAAWDEKRAGRAMPARIEVVPRAIGHLLKYVSLVRVVSGDDDFEFRIIGDVHVQAYGSQNQGRRLSDIARDAPSFASKLKRSFEAVIKSGAPVAYGGLIGRDVGDARFVAFESVFLPLADDANTVDHIITAGVYAPRGGFWPDTSASF